MHLLVPKLTPMQLVLYFSALIICWFYDDGTTSEGLYGIPPLLAVGLLATSAAAAAAPARPHAHAPRAHAPRAAGGGGGGRSEAGW